MFVSAIEKGVGNQEGRSKGCEAFSMSTKQILNDRDLQGPSAQSGTAIRKRVNSVNNIRLACGHATDQHQSMTATQSTRRASSRQSAEISFTPLSTRPRRRQLAGTTC